MGSPCLLVDLWDLRVRAVWEELLRWGQRDGGFGEFSGRFCLVCSGTLFLFFLLSLSFPLVFFFFGRAGKGGRIPYSVWK